MQRIFLLTLLAAIGLEAQTASLPDTLTWMDNTYNYHLGIGVYGHGIRYSPGRDHRLLWEESFTYTGTQFTLHQRNQSVTCISTFNLRDINPQSIELTHYWPSGNLDAVEIIFISFSTHLNAPLIDVAACLTDGKYTEECKPTLKYKNTDAQWNFDDADYARRFVKAFRHAVELAGGKPDPF
jgi:hypothetical protein